MNDELYHAGIKGMKWGRRRFQNPDGSLTPEGKKRYGANYQSTGISAALARRSNVKVDKGFENWKENEAKRDNAIALGKKATEARLAYESNRSDKNLKAQYKSANKEYKKALGQNTTYRKGVVRQEVGRDAARKYLSEAKKVGKQLANDPSNKALKKKYNELMSKHDIERANARRATEVSSKRSNKIASIKRMATVTVKAAAGTAAVAAGVYAVNRYLSSHNVTLNGQRVSIGSQTISNIAEVARKVKDAFGYFY